MKDSYTNNNNKMERIDKIEKKVLYLYNILEQMKKVEDERHEKIINIIKLLND